MADEPLTFDDCCHAIMQACRDPKQAKALNYAYGYASAGVGMIGKEQQVQALYILNNITHWRGEKAKPVRAALKKFGEYR